jgi:hypothetical protein
MGIYPNFAVLTSGSSPALTALTGLAAVAVCVPEVASGGLPTQALSSIEVAADALTVNKNLRRETGEKNWLIAYPQNVKN